MQTYRNPVELFTGEGSLSALRRLLANESYLLLTHPGAVFAQAAQKVERAAGHAPLAIIAEVADNPDPQNLSMLCERLRAAPERPTCLVALGGGSVIDACKVLSATRGDFNALAPLLDGRAIESVIPYVAIPTTAGTGSEVTSWATVWDPASDRKHSLADPLLYARAAIMEPELTVSLPRALTISTALDALSHAFESLWNRNRNPVSSVLAIAAARRIIDTLPRVLAAPCSLAWRQALQEAALQAGLAFSNTKTSLAHNISYPITMQKGVPHGIACSITLPMLVRSISPDEPVATDIEAILGVPLADAGDALESFFAAIGIDTDPRSYGYEAGTWHVLVAEAAQGQRGRNFNGNVARVQALYDQHFTREFSR